MANILVVEDEKRMAQTLERGLTQSGHQISLIIHGSKAMQIDISDYDLVLLDWMLPGVSGIDLLRHWRRCGQQTPIIMLTAKTHLTDKVSGLNYGADDYISKFFEWPELLARISALLRRSSETGHTQNILSWDSRSKCFWEKGRIILLTPKERVILKYIFDRPNRLISKQALLQHVYQDENDTNSNVIERHIHSLRSKFEHEPIQTIRGLGYRLNPVLSVSSSKN